MWTRHFKRILRKLYEKAAVRLKILRRIRSSIDTSVQKRKGGGGGLIIDFFQLITFYKRKRAVLYLTAVMALHVFHLRIIFDDYIMTLSTYKQLENSKTAQGQT